MMFSVASRRFWLAGVCLLLATPLAALNPRSKIDQFSLRGWFTEDGLPSSRIRAALQTRDGYLWLATSQGIARFDGNQFTVFSPSTRSDLTAVNFYDLCEMPDGTLWFASNAGLFHFSDDHFERFGTAEGLPVNY